MKHNCKTCIYFQRATDAELADARAKGAQFDPANRPGNCRRNPPRSHVITAPVMQKASVAIMRGNGEAPPQIGMNVQPMTLFPTVAEGAFCGEHSAFFLEKVKAEENARLDIYFARRAAYDNRLKYDPGAHPESGFNRVPSLAEARAFDPDRNPVLKDRASELNPTDAPGG